MIVKIIIILIVMSNVVKNIISCIVHVYARELLSALLSISNVYKRAMFGCRTIFYLLLFLFCFFFSFLAAMFDSDIISLKTCIA
jgi:flagellar biosynthesis protein FlhB